MICVVKKWQPGLRIPLTLPDSGGCPLRDYEHVCLSITHPRPALGYEDSPIFREGCWPGYWPEPHPWPWDLPALIYPPCDLDATGAVLFRFDDKLRKKPPGRYMGIIHYRHEPLAWIDIDLRDHDWIPKHPTETVVGEEPCHDTRPF